MKIIDFDPQNEAQVCQAARVLVAGFREHWPDAWPDLESGLEEMSDFAADPERICLLAVDEEGAVLGWIGGLPEYDGHSWELHPLVVDPLDQGRGIGRVLVGALEARIGARGGGTIFLGSDDEDQMTTLGGVDLFPDVFEHVARIRNLKGHPYEFYQKLGYVIVGVIPDANGPGQPDIIMAKRIGAND